MDDDALANLLINLAKSAEKYAPSLAKTISLYKQKLLASTARKPTGGLTDEANRALQWLRNPVFKSTHVNEARSVAARNLLEVSESFAKSLQLLTRDWALLEQAKLEHELLKDAGAAEPSREERPIESRPDVLRFYEEMEARGVAPFMPGRLSSAQYDVIARLIADANLDRAGEDAENLWRQLFSNGVLQAFHGQLTADQAALLNEVYAIRIDPDAAELADRVGKRIGREMNVTPLFLAACQRVLDRSGDLSDAEASALFFAGGERFSVETEQLAKLLGLGAAEKRQVEALVSFVKGPGSRLVDAQAHAQYRIDRVIHTLAEVIRSLEEHHIPPREWLPFLDRTLLQPDGFIARNLPDAETFWLLLGHVLENSESHKLFKAQGEQEERDAREAFHAGRRRWFESQGIAYQVEADGWVSPVSTQERSSDDSPPPDSISDAEFDEIGSEPGDNDLDPSVSPQPSVHELIMDARSWASAGIPEDDDDDDATWLDEDAAPDTSSQPPIKPQQTRFEGFE